MLLPSLQIVSVLGLPCSSTFLVYIKQGLTPTDKQVKSYDASDTTLAAAMRCPAQAKTLV